MLSPSVSVLSSPEHAYEEASSKTESQRRVMAADSSQPWAGCQWVRVRARNSLPDAARGLRQVPDADADRVGRHGRGLARALVVDRRLREAPRHQAHAPEPLGEPIVRL